MKKSIIIEIICFLFIVLFVYAAVSKLMDVEKFRIQIGKSPLLTNFASVVAWAIPIFEILISVMLAIRKVRSIALHAAFTLMMMFTAYIVAIMNFSDYIPCSCGGVLTKMRWGEHLVFNIGFVLIALVGIVLNSKESSIKSTEGIASPIN